MKNIQSRAKLTSKGQVTIPIATRKALDLHEGDSIAFRVLDGGKVEMFKESSVSSDDSVVAAYLKFLEQDLLVNPGKLAPFVRPKGVDALVEEVDLEGWLDEETGEYYGRIVDVAQLKDGSLLVSDDTAGAIYRISYQGN